MDWSSNGDPRALLKLKGIVDEVVIQTYQGRSTIWGSDGRWIEPTGLRTEPNFKGYVAFLLPRRA